MKQLLSGFLLLICIVCPGGVDLFHPDAGTIRAIGDDPEMKRIRFWAERSLKAKPLDADRTIEKGKSYGLYLYTVGTTLTRWMESLGYTYLVTGDETYARKGAELLAVTCRDFPVDHPRIAQGLPGERGQILYGVAIGWIYFRDFLADADRVMIEKTVADYIDETVKLADDPQTWWYDIHNHNGVMFGPAGMTCLLFRDRPGFEKRLRDCTRILKRWINSGFDDRGLPCEGSVYARYSAMRVMLFALMLRDRGEEDLFKTTKLGRWPHVYIDKQIPGTNLTETRNDAYYAPPGLECLFVSVANQDPVAEWVYRNYSDGGTEYFPLNRLLEARKRPAPAMNFEQHSKSAFFKQRRLGIWRTGWSKDDVMLSIESGPYLTAKSKGHSIHAQADRGHFNLYAYGDLWAVDTGYGNDAARNPEFTRSHTFAHSCVLVNGKGQGRSGNGPGVSGETLVFEDKGIYGYAKTDNSSAYNGNNWGEEAAGVKHALRDVLFVRPGEGGGAYAVVFDNIEKPDKAEHVFTWQMMLLADKEVELRPGGALIRNAKPFTSYAVTPAGKAPGTVGWKVKLDRSQSCSVWGLVRSGSYSIFDSDSFFLSFDGGERMVWDSAAREFWSWQRIGEPYNQRESLPKSKMFDFSAGEHRITLATRERGAEIKALFLGFSPDAAPGVPGKGILLPAEDAEVSGGMVKLPTGDTTSENRCAVYLDAASDAGMYLDTITPANNARPPTVILRLRGDVKAKNPFFTSVLIPLKPEMKEPEVAFDRSRPGRVTVTVRWKNYVDTIVWNTSKQGRATFSRRTAE